MSDQHTAADRESQATRRSAAELSRVEAESVLPEDVRTALREAAARWRRARTPAGGELPPAALPVLLVGASTRQATTAAQLLAETVGHTAHVARWSTVVSRFIGETEKNLDRVLSRASEQNVVLFFDEADALFGKVQGVDDRTRQVNASHDRYANQEVAYLLRRLESHTGIVGVAVQGALAVPDEIARRFAVVVSLRS